MTQVLRHARKNRVCGRATYAWVECSVYHPSLTKESPLPASETPWFCKKISLAPFWCLLPSQGRRACWWLSVVPLPACLWVDAPNLRSVKQTVGLVAFEFALGDKFVVSLARFLIQTFFNSVGLLIIFSLIHGSVRSWTITHENPSVFAASCSFDRRSDVGMVLGPNLIQSCTMIFNPPMSKCDCR